MVVHKPLGGVTTRSLIVPPTIADPLEGKVGSAVGRGGKDSGAACALLKLNTINIAQLNNKPSAGKIRRLIDVMLSPSRLT
jgi:hypothetical protein